MRGKEHRRPGGLRFPHQFQHRFLVERVEAGGRLIEDQQLGPVHERLYQPDLLLIAAGVFAERHIEIQFQPPAHLFHEALIHAAA